MLAARFVAGEGPLPERVLECRRHLEAYVPLVLAGVGPGAEGAADPAAPTNPALSAGGGAASSSSRPTGFDPSSPLTAELLLAERAPSGAIAHVSGLQIPGVLDSLYEEKSRDLGHSRGARIDEARVTFNVWAPTARAVRLVLAPGEGEEHVEMVRESDGSWSSSIPLSRGAACGREEPDREITYLYEIDVFVPAEGRFVTNRVTDPYSLALTVDSKASVVVDLDSKAAQPEGWGAAPTRGLERPCAHAIYELHVRDFSASDETVPEELRGTYAAFGVEGSAGMAHLRRLAEAGLTSVHLLPIFDIASIPEDRARQKVADVPNAGRNSAEQQRAVSAVRESDAYNWGYDPLHYMAPEGSYAREGHQDGAARIKECRGMIEALHAAGLGVILDQVYNHTFANGQNELSILDRVVPGYYHRLNERGEVEDSTCTSNTATEHYFAERLMIDAILTWARHYRVDGFRFDLMGHHARSTMEKVRAELDALTLESDGVDGARIYLYGEGWNFGEVANNVRFQQATQGQLDGTGIGCFNDRVRDAVHGGSPFDENKRAGQGFGTGCYTDPNGIGEGDSDVQRAELRRQTDLVKLALAGNLKDYPLRTCSGEVVRGSEVRYGDAPAGYASEPSEAVNYVDAHDNETLWDTLLMKLPEQTSLEDRVRMTVLSLATVALGQSPAFWHAGTDLLRSKSLDRDSYDSGDYFNRIDWTGARNNQGVGLPPAHRNEAEWGMQAPLLANADLEPRPEHIRAAREAAADLLRIRASSPLLTLGSAALIREKVSFGNCGPGSVDGVILMHIDDAESAVDPKYGRILVAFNQAPHEQVVSADLSGAPEGARFTLHPVQAAGSDEVVKVARVESGAVSIPPRTVAVFVEERPR